MGKAWWWWIGAAAVVLFVAWPLSRTLRLQAREAAAAPCEQGQWHPKPGAPCEAIPAHGPWEDYQPPVTRDATVVAPAEMARVNAELQARAAQDAAHADTRRAVREAIEDDRRLEGN